MNLQAHERARKAVEMRVAGNTLARIRDDLNYGDEASVRRAIQRYVLRTMKSEDVAEMRHIWGERYESVWRAFARKALNEKDEKAAAVILKAGDQAAKLYGLNVNEALMAGAAGVTAVADLAAASMLQANLIGVLHEVRLPSGESLPMETIEQVIALLNNRMGAASSDEQDEAEPVVIVGEVEAAPDSNPSGEVHF